MRGHCSTYILCDDMDVNIDYISLSFSLLLLFIHTALLIQLFNSLLQFLYLSILLLFYFILLYFLIVCEASLYNLVHHFLLFHGTSSLPFPSSTTFTFNINSISFVSPFNFSRFTL